ncbi:MAG: LacI family DNA-binding transcriptional regulator [Candidatus Nanopelagicales bacterium]
MVTRKDVAERAGVSPATVSYALTPGRPIAETTRQRVLAAAAELGYVPNAMARGLAGGRAQTLAMLIPPAERGVAEADMEYLVGATVAAQNLGYQVLLWPLNRAEVANDPRLSSGGLIGGVLLMEVVMDDERIAHLQQERMPFALIGRTRQPDGLLFADRDFDEVGRVAVNHLAGLGHRDIAFLSAPQEARDFGFAAIERAEAGMLAAARAAGVRLTIVACDATPAAGREALVKLARTPQTAAVISFNEEATFGLYHGAQAQGLRIPADLSIMSISASPKRATLFYPALTAVSPPAQEIAATAARALIASLEGLDIEPGPRLWTGELIERASTAPPAHRPARPRRTATSQTGSALGTRAS